MADQPADDSGQFHGGYTQQGWPPNDSAQKPAFYNPQQMPATSGGAPMFFNPASFDTGAAPPFLPQQGPAHPPQQQWDNPTYPPQQQQPTWNSHEVQNGPPHQGGYQGGGNVQQNEYPQQQQPYPGWQDQDLYAPPVSDPLTDSRASSSFYESSGQSSTLGLGFSYSSENPSLNSSERTSPMLAGGDYGQGHGFPYDGTGMDIPRDGMQQQPPAEGAAMFRQPEGNSLPNDSGPGGQYFSGPGNTNTAASVPQVSMFTPQFGLPEESRSAASLGQEEGEGSLTRELTGQEQSEENVQQFPPQPQNTQLPPAQNLEGSQTGPEAGSWDFGGGAPHQEIRRELTGQEDGLDSQPPQDPTQFASQPSEPPTQPPPMLNVEEPTAGIPTPSPGHSRSSSQQFDTISLGSGKDGNPSRSGSRASSLIVEGQAQPGVTPAGSNSGMREEFDVGTKPVGDHSRSGSVDSGRSGPGIADGPPQSVAQTEPVGGTERSRSGSAESGRSARSSRSGSGVAPPAPPLNVPYQEGAAMERSRSGSAESGRSGGSGGRPPSLSRHSQSNDSIHSAGSNPTLSSQPPLLEEQSPGDGAPSPQPGRPSDVGPGDSPEGAASPDEPTQPQQGDGEPEPPPQNTRPPQARPSGHSPPPPSRPSIPNFPIFSPMEGSMAPQFLFASNFPNAGPSMPSPIQHSASSPFQPVATRPQPFPARTEHNGFPGEGQDSTPTSGNDNSTVDRQDREVPQVARQPSREEHHQHGRENLLEREPLPRREDMRNEPRERRTSGQRDGAEGEQSVPPPPMPAQPLPSQAHHSVHAHHRKQEERRESTPTASLWASDVPASVPSVILAPAAPPTLTQAPSVQPHPVPMFVPAPNLPSTMQAPPIPAASPPEKQQPQQPPASAIPSSSAFGTPLSTAAASAPTTSATTPSSQQSPQSTETYRNASAPPPDSTNHGAQQTVPPASAQSYSTPPLRQTSTASNSSYTSQSGRPTEERTQERRNPQESQPSPSRSPRQVAGNESKPDDRYGQRTQPQKPAGQATQQADTRRDVPPPSSTQSNQQPSDADYTRTRDYRGREGDTSYSAQEPERPSSRSSNHGGDRDWDRDKDDRYYDRRDSWYDQRDRRYDSRRDYYQERDYRSRSYEQDPRYGRQGSYDSYYGRQESRERERPSSRQERERPSSRQGDRPRSRQDYDREAYYRQYSADYDRSGYYDQEKYRRRRDYYGREYDSRGQRDPRYSRERGSQRSKSVDNTDYWANDPRYQEWYNYYYGRHGNSYDPRYYEYYKQQMQQQQQQQQQQSQGYDLYAYDPRYDNTYDDENYEDDRRSVHSNASGHSSHSHHSQGWGGQYDDRFARDFHRDSGHGDTSGYGHNGGYGDNSWYRDSWQQGQTPAARTTPAKFHIPHVLARFGPGGHMIKVLPNNPADGMPAVVEVHALETLLVNNTEVEEFRVFPGPLIKGVTHKSDVIRFCQDKAAASLASTELRDKESAALLWQLLELLCRQNGTIVGTDIAELLLQGHPSMAYPQRTEAEGEDRGSQGDLSQASTTSDGTVGGTEAADIERLTQKFRELLLFGRKKDALEWAMKGGLWGHALLLASKMDSRAHANVMTRFANSLPMNDPLQTLYQLMSHRQPAAVTSCADERWGDWRPHLAMVLSNHTQRPEVDRKSIITLGDTLGSRGLLHAAHFCYLMAQVNFGHYSKKASKMVLLGSSHSLPFMEFASNEAIQMTEVYEYAMTLGNAAHYILPSFQEYKFLYATRLAECGMTAQALTYCECIVSAVERAPTSFSSTLISQLHQLSERLFWHDPHFSSLSAEEDQDYDWINSIRYMNQQVLEGALLPSSASDTPMFVGSTEPSIDGTSTPTPGETTFTGVGTPQYDPSQQEQYEGYNASGMDPAAYQQQGGTDSPYQQYQQQQQMDPNASYQPWSKPVPADMNLMASMNSEYSTTSATTDGGTETENDVPDYYDQMAGQVRLVQQQHRGTPDSQGSQSRLRALSGSSHASTTRARSMSGSSQLSHGSQRIRRRQRTTSESSQVDIKEEPAQKKQEKVPNSRQASAKPKDSNISSQSHQGQKSSAQRSGGTSWLGGLFTKMMRGKNEIHLPDDTNKSIVWDAARNKWVNQDEGEEEDAAPPPPPPKDPMPSPAGGPAPPPGNTPNRFSRRAGPTGKYVDVLNQSGTTKPAAPPPDLFPGLVPTGNAMPNLFVPAAVPTSDANEPQGSQLQGTMTQGDPQGPHVPTQVQQQPPMFYNPNEPMTSAAQVPPTSTPNSQAQLSRSSSMSSMSYEVSHLLKAQQPQDSAGPPVGDQGVAPPPQAVAAPPMFFNPSSFSAQNSPFNSPGQGPTGLGSRPRYARPR